MITTYHIPDGPRAGLYFETQADLDATIEGLKKRLDMVECAPPADGLSRFDGLALRVATPVEWVEFTVVSFLRDAKGVAL